MNGRRRKSCSLPGGLASSSCVRAGCSASTWRLADLAPRWWSATWSSRSGRCCDAGGLSTGEEQVRVEQCPSRQPDQDLDRGGRIGGAEVPLDDAGDDEE